MKLEYTLTLADYQAAQFLHWHQTLVRRVVHFSIYDGLPSIAAGMGCVLAKRAGLMGTKLPYWAEFLFGLAVALIYLKATAKRRKAERYRKHFERRIPSEKRRAWIEINEVGVTSAIVGTELESHEWSTLFGFAQDNKMTLLYLAKKQFLLFPTQAMSSVQRAELAGLVARYVTARHR